MGIKDEIEVDLKNTSGDYVHSTVNAAISSIPALGSVASEIFNMVIVAPLEKRKEKWMLKIAESLEELQNKVDGFDVNKLCNNELFVSVLNRASQLALSNHQEEKIFALKNAVMNTALNISIDENEEMMFLNLIDVMTPWHLKIIFYFDNPKERFEEISIKPTEYMMGSPVLPLQEFYPELKSRNDFINLIVNDLYNRGIFSIDDLNCTMSSSGMYVSRLTEFGRRFLNYIKEPQI